jgi:hypothetical protein
MTYANLIDPGVDATSYGARAAQRKNYMGGGKQYQELQAIGTVAGHLQNLMQSADALNNFQNLGPLNAIANNVKVGYENLSQDPRIAKFETDRNAVTRELTKAYQGGHITDSSVAEWQKSINSAQTPEQLHTVIGELNNLLMSKRQTLEEGYRQTMGPNAPLPGDFSSVNERTRSIFDNVNNWANGGPMKIVKEGQGSAPTSSVTPGMTSTGLKWSVQ